MINREDALRRLHKEVKEGRPIIGAGAGTGLSAKCAEAGGTDLIIIYNSGRYRMAGRGSLAGLLPYGDANAIVVEMAGEVLPVVQDTPVLAGVCGTDPFRLMPVFLKAPFLTAFTFLPSIILSVVPPAASTLAMIFFTAAAVNFPEFIVTSLASTAGISFCSAAPHKVQV